jgi:hypothetical protein
LRQHLEGAEPEQFLLLLEALFNMPVVAVAVNTIPALLVLSVLLVVAMAA